MELTDKLKEYSELLDQKKALEDQMKEVNSKISYMKNRISDIMAEEEVPRISSGGYTFTSVIKTKYSKKSAEALAKDGIDFLGTLREEGLGDIIQETVLPQTLQASIKAYVEANGELSPGLESIINSYDYADIVRRKERK